MKTEEIRGMSDADLGTKVQDLQHERLNLKIQQQSGQLERPSRLKEIRKSLARIQTVMTERRLTAAQENTK
ncbi:MAG: 50S ribosomal protein L29 [Verrucomicrobiota bacterium]